MRGGPPKNIAASARARLRARAQEEGRPFDELLQHYAIERVLYRIGSSQHAEHFLLKGALMLRAHDIARSRPTRDIDLLGRIPITPVAVEQAIRECLQIEVDDGMEFILGSVSSEQISVQSKSPGARITFQATLDGALASLQIDVGFGDVVVPGPLRISYPQILDLGAPSLLAYTLESAVAEKYEAMVSLGEANSRMKDFFDIALVARKHSFDGRVVGEAMRRTFAARGTSLPESQPIALTAAFSGAPEKQRQWSAFLRRTGIDFIPTLSVAVEQIASFVLPPSIAVAEGEVFPRTWKPGGPWE